LTGRLGGRPLLAQDLGGDRTLLTDAGLTLGGGVALAPAAELVIAGPLINGLDEWCGYDAILGQSASCAEGLSCINALCTVLDLDAFSGSSDRSGDVFQAGSDPFVILGDRLSKKEMEAMLAE